MRRIFNWTVCFMFIGLVGVISVGHLPGQPSATAAPAYDVHRLCAQDYATKLVGMHRFRVNSGFGNWSVSGNHFHMDEIKTQYGTEDGYRIISDCFLDTSGQPHTTMVVQ